MGTLLNIGILAVSLVVGVGIGMFLIPQLLPFLDEQTKIIIAAVLTLSSFVSLYFMTKSHGGS